MCLFLHSLQGQPTLGSFLLAKVRTSAPPAEKMGDADGKAGPEKETGKNSKTSPCFSRYLPDFAATFGIGESPPVQSEFFIVCFPFVSGGVSKFHGNEVALCYWRIWSLPVLIGAPSKPAVSSGKRRRTVTVHCCAVSNFPD